jgi:fatty-acid desaturase
MAWPWYELDITWLQLKALETLGVIQNLKVAKIDAALPEAKAA